MNETKIQRSYFFLLNIKQLSHKLTDSIENLIHYKQRVQNGYGYESD